MALIFEGLLIGVFIGLALRPVLDAYVLWRYQRELAEVSRHAYAQDRDAPQG